MATDIFKTFEDYSLVAKKSLENVLHDDNMVRENKPQVIYALPPVAFSQFIQNTQNGEKPGPLVSIYLASISVDNSVQLGGWKKLTYYKNNFTIRAPIIAELDYRIVINAVKESQADLLLSQIMLAMPFNRPYATMLNGQWVTMVSSNYENDQEPELTEKDKIIKRECELKIERAYLDYPIQVNSSFIKEINAHVYSVDSQKGVIG